MWFAIVTAFAAAVPITNVAFHPFSIVVDKGNVISYADAWLMLNTLPESLAIKTLAAATSTMFFLVLKNTLPIFNYFFSC